MIETPRCIQSSNPEGYNSSGILLFFVNGAGQRRILLTAKFFRCNTSRPSVYVANKGLTQHLSPLDATFTKKRGGVFFLIWNSFPPAGLGARTQSSGKNAMSTGDGTSTTYPLA